MAATIDEITVDYTDETGKQVVRQIDKQVLNRGAWTTILFLYSEWDKKTDDWGPPKARIERYQKRNDEYRSQSRFKFTSFKQMKQIMDVFETWFSSGQFTEE